jgi:hypothetical protein
MPHLEEGTIHAWLDGALDETEAASVARHAAECESCAAMVAEARGFIAGASRIISALDVVRGGVIPPSGSGAPARDQLAARRRSIWSTLHLTPARAAIAATVLVAVGSLLSVRGGRSGLDLESRAAADRAVSRTEQVPLAAPAAVPTTMDSVSTPPGSRDLASGSRVSKSARAKAVNEVLPSRQALEKQSIVSTSVKDAAREFAASGAAKKLEAREMPAVSQVAGAAAPLPSPAPSAPPATVGRVAGAAKVAANAPRDQRALADTAALRRRDVIPQERRVRADSLSSASRNAAVAQTRSSFAQMSEAVLDPASAAEGCYSVVGSIPPWASMTREFALDRAIVADSAPERRVVRSASSARSDGPIGGAWWRLTSTRGVEVTWPGATNAVVLTMQPAGATIAATISDAAHSESMTLTRVACSQR